MMQLRRLSFQRMANVAAGRPVAGTGKLISGRTTAAIMTAKSAQAISLTRNRGFDPMPDPRTILRDATEDDVALALDRAYISTPLSDPAELLEFFNRMVDVMLGEEGT